ncbi:hypothetical protein C8N24_0944 [Solirubrobacter pauli]|uniref:Fibronectin type-III domain-containing protein n=1 Tax=Solirubrobacter pauli TaxID=166793 RepID=A0A660L7U8_9ACTN|nr:hypothetical protein [Solirubrobacter pauli]RKQ91127.1 hypothetical protein C8N24_0944 [Solirubrobacter pauli]
MLRAILITLAVLAFPAGASAAPFGELPFQSAGGAAACLRPTGAPGEVVRWVRGGVQTMTARADGLHPTGGVPLGTSTRCPDVTGHPNGAAVLAAAVTGGIRVALREPGAGSWSPPVTLKGQEYSSVADVAISPRGDVVLAWTETGEAIEARTTVRVARRPAGGTFGAPETLIRPAEETLEAEVQVGISAAGEAIVAQGRPAGQFERVSVRVGAANAPLGPEQRLVSRRVGSGPSLAVAPDGRALIGVGGPMDAPVLYERPPGGSFGPAVKVDLRSDFDAPVVALRADGAAVVVSGQGESAIEAVTRAAPGPFGTRVEVAPALPVHRRADFGVLYGVVGTNPPPESFPDVGVTFTADGRALVLRATEERGLSVATFPVATGAPSEHSLVGGTLRAPYGLSPLTLPDGRLAVAWTDDRGLHDSTRRRDGRLHLAVEGVPGPVEAAAPKVTVGTPKVRALRPAQSLKLPVRCSAACDVRVAVPGYPSPTDVTGSLARAGTMELVIRPASDGLAPARGRLRLVLRSSAPNARTVQRQTVSLALRRLPPPRVPRLLGVRARRVGDDIVVRWRTDGPVLDAYFLVYATKGRARGEGVVAIGTPKRLAGRAFTVRLRDARAARYVWVSLAPLSSGMKGRSVRLKVPLT